MKAKQLSLIMAPMAWCISALVASAAIVVDYNAPNQGAGSLAAATGFANQDLDGDSSNDDSFVVRAFTNPPPPAPGGSPWSTGASYTGPTLYGGVIGQALNIANKQSFDSYGFDTGGFNIRYQVTGTGQSGRLAMAVVFQSSDTGLVFSTGPSGTSYMRIAGTGSGGMLSNFENLGDVRWLVRNGTDYYVSQTLIANNNTGGRELNATELATEMWALYNPTDAFDFSLTLNFNTPTSSLNNMNAFGLITYKSTFTNARHWIRFTQFQVDAIPEPSTLGLIGAIAGLGLLRKKRQKA